MLPSGHRATHSKLLSHLADASDISRMPVTVSIIIEGIGVRELSRVSTLLCLYCEGSTEDNNNKMASVHVRNTRLGKIVKCNDILIVIKRLFINYYSGIHKLNREFVCIW